MRWQVIACVAMLCIGPTIVSAQGTAAGVARVEEQAAYVTRCRNETIARFPNARAQADTICQSNWSQIMAAGPLADAILVVAPAQGMAFNPVTVRTALASVQWSARPEQGSVVSGRLGDLDVVVTRMPTPGVTLRWFKNGEPIPFNLDEAFRVRGAGLTMIACLAFSSAEDTRVFRVTASGKSPFVLTIARREAAVASQSSDFSASTDFSGTMPSLAVLRRDGSQWQQACP